MFSLPSLRKLTLLVAAAAVAAPLALSTSASARVVYRHVGPARFYHGPRYYPRPGFYPGRRVFYPGPGFYAPVYPVARCFVRRKWVPGPFGYHWASSRVCY